MKTTDLIIPNVVGAFQDVLNLGLKPDSFNAETAISRGYPGATREGSPSTLVDVEIPPDLALDVKSTGSIKVLKRRPKSGNYFEYEGLYVVIPDSTLCITRRPDVDCFECSAEEGIKNSLKRLKEFHDKSLEASRCSQIKSLLIQHSWSEDRDWTVFNFSLQQHKIPTVTRFEKTDRNVLLGYDQEGEIIAKHDYFTKGSQNFHKMYYRSLDSVTVIIKKINKVQVQKSWEDLDGVILRD